MKLFMDFVRKFIPKSPSTPLGRWNIDYCNKKMARKIDLANEDNCGPCGQYSIPNNLHSKNKYTKTSHFAIKNL